MFAGKINKYVCRNNALTSKDHTATYARDYIINLCVHIQYIQ